MRVVNKYNKAEYKTALYNEWVNFPTKLDFNTYIKYREQIIEQAERYLVMQRAI